MTSCLVSLECLSQGKVLLFNWIQISADNILSNIYINIHDMLLNTIEVVFFRLFGKASKFGLWYGIPRNPTAVEMSDWSKSGAIIDNLLTSREQILCQWNLIQPSHRTKMRWKIWFVKFWWQESTVQALMQKCVLFDTMKSYQKRKRNFKHFSCLFYQKMTRFILWF